MTDGTGTMLQPRADGQSAPGRSALYGLWVSPFVLKGRSALTRLGAFLSRWRVPLSLAAFALFLVGAIWSLQSTGLAYDELDWIAFVALTFGLTFLNLCYSASSMVLLGRTAGVDIRFGQAFQTGTFAQLAEALPLPGGALVRAAALAKAGASVGKGATLVIATALIWVGLSLLGAGAYLVTSFPSVGWGFLVAGLALTAAPSLIVARVGGTANMLATLFNRILGLGLLAWRMVLAFTCLGASISAIATMPYVFATVVGSASSVVPGGLGISEALGASIAHLTQGVRPETAFLAIAVNRVTSFIGTAVFALMIQLMELLTMRRNGEKL
jgi:hypothetical protein